MKVNIIFWIITITIILNFFFYMALHNRKLSKKQLRAFAPIVNIKESFFINMDRSVDRKNSFITRFTDTNGPQPLTRIPGVLVEDKSIKKPGNYGCALAHVNVMREILKKSEGWYLVCEDDGYGNFGAIIQNPIVRAIVAHTEKKYINLSAQWWNGKPERHKNHYSLSKVNSRTTAYLIHSSIANEVISVVSRYNYEYIDLILASSLQEPRLLRSGNGKGAFVPLIDPPLDIFDTDRMRLNGDF